MVLVDDKTASLLNIDSEYGRTGRFCQFLDIHVTLLLLLDWVKFGEATLHWCENCLVVYSPAHADITATPSNPAPVRRWL